MTADNGIPVILKHGKALLINAPISRLGHECFEGREGITKNNVSKLLRETLKKELADLSSPLVSGKNVGITLFETKDGRKMLLAIDYSPYDNIAPHTKEAVVTINCDFVKDASSERDLRIAKKDGYVKELRFDIAPHESVFIELT